MENDGLNVSNLMFVWSDASYLIAELLLKLFSFAKCMFQRTQWGFIRDRTKIISSINLFFIYIFICIIYNTFTEIFRILHYFR